MALISLGLFASAEEKFPLKITEIGLTRSGGKAGSPQDTLTLRSDGTAAYVGVKNVARIGEYQGKIPDWYFLALSDMYAAFTPPASPASRPTA